MSFTGHEAPITRMITLPVTIGEWLKVTTEMIDFMFMDLPSAYNAIHGRVSQSQMEIIFFVKH